MTSEKFKEISRKLAHVALETGAVQFNSVDPFTWASGYRMPIYNDNRLLLGYVSYRNLVAEGFRETIRLGNIPVEIIAGAATAGIPHATLLANLMELPMIYVRPKPKEHGMGNQVEGPLLKGQRTVVVEDLVSTGGSALEVVSAIRAKGALADYCLSIFNYGFKETEKAFSEANCGLYSLLSLPVLLAEAEYMGKMSSGQSKLLRNWQQDPFNWGDGNGFPKK